MVEWIFYISKIGLIILKDYSFKCEYTVFVLLKSHNTNEMFNYNKEYYNDNMTLITLKTRAK